jgi:hypothetical protein
MVFGCGNRWCMCSSGCFSCDVSVACEKCLVYPAVAPHTSRIMPIFTSPQCAFASPMWATLLFFLHSRWRCAGNSLNVTADSILRQMNLWILSLLIFLSLYVHVHKVNGQAANGRGRSLPAIQRWPFQKLAGRWSTVPLGLAGPIPLGSTVHSCNQSILIDS